MAEPADPLAVECRYYCAAPAGESCQTASGKVCKPHAARKRLARWLAADSDPALDAYFPRRGQCLICGVPGLDQRHRVVDAIAGMLAAGEEPEVVADELEVPLGAVQVVGEWAKRWGV